MALSDVLNARTMAGFTAEMLAARYDNPQPIPPLHYDLWNAALSGHLHNAFAAPREHAKSTAITHAMTIALIVFRVRDFGLIISDTERQATDHLNDIRAEFVENEMLKSVFMFDKLTKETDTRIIGRFKDGHVFRLDAKGTEQKVRGIKWMRKRPNFVVCDDIENDELVMNSDRREKVRKWFMKALLNVGTAQCLFVIVGTILHEDALLRRLLQDKTWNSLCYRAHAALDDFSDILWPEQWPEQRLRDKKAQFAAQYDLEGYAQEFLNEPVAEGETLFRKQDFIPSTEVEKKRRMRYYSAADFAISIRERADFTALVTVGVDFEGLMHVVDVRKGRWDSLQICDELFSVQKRYRPELFAFESEKIDKALGPFINARMVRSGEFINIHKFASTKDKISRARSIAARMRAGGVHFDTESEWFDDFQHELMMVTPAGPRGAHDDMFDAFALIGQALDMYSSAMTDEQFDEEEYWQDVRNTGHTGGGRSSVTGY